MKYDLIIKNVNAVLENEIKKSDIAVKGERTAGIYESGSQTDAAHIIDGSGKYLFPGGIDTHSHFFEPGPTYREDFYHGTQAAAMGGFTTVMDMPNTDPPVDNDEHFQMKKKKFSENGHVDFVIWGAALPGKLDHIPRLKQLGAVAFKAFTSYAGESYPYSKTIDILEGMEKVKSAGGIYAVHAENENIIAALRKRYAGSTWSLEMHERSRPWYAELAAVGEVALLSRITGCPLHICHMSIPEGVELINEMREKGADITIETCPHYLLLDYKSFSNAGTFAEVNPPLRSRERVDRMWKYVADGSLDYMGTDHAPYTYEDKNPANLWDAPGGGPNIDIAIPMVLEEAIKKRGLNYIQMAKFISTNAAKRFGLYPKKGVIKIGSDADFVLIDMNREWSYSRKNCLSKTKETGFPYEGRKIGCYVEATILRGKVIYQNGKITVDAGYGKFIS